MKSTKFYFVTCFFLFAYQITAQEINQSDSSFIENIKGINFKMIKIPKCNYYVAQGEVTQELWYALTNENPSQYQNCPQCPVESVSYNDITEKFLPKLNQLAKKKYRLPTYREWFFAALGGNKYKSPPKEDINEISWNYESSKLTPQPIMTKKTNAYGLYDIKNAYLPIYSWG